MSLNKVVVSHISLDFWKRFLFVLGRYFFPNFCLRLVNEPAGISGGDGVFFELGNGSVCAFLEQNQKKKRSDI